VVDGTRHSVLIVEDNPAALKLFRGALEEAGYDVRVACDGRSALEEATRDLPGLILQDLVLPDMEGLALARLLRALPRRGALPVIALSGFKTLLDRAAAMPESFDATLLKPVELAQLVEAVGRYLPLPSRAEDSFGVGKSVLVVDDDPIQLKLVRLRLEHVGFDVMTASDRQTALEVAQSHPPDVVLCDVLMPGTDGYELCQELRSMPRFERVPVVLVSAFYGGSQDEKLARGAGASALVLRTPDLDQVFSALRSAVRSDGAESRPGTPRSEPQLPRKEHLDRVRAQLERQTRTNAGVAERSTLQGAQLSILAGIAEALLRSEDVAGAFGDILTACLDAGGISRGALYRVDEQGVLALDQKRGFPDMASDALERALGCSARVVHATHGVVVPVSTCLPPDEARAFFSSARLNAAVFVPFLEGDRCIGALLLGSSSAELGEHDLTVFARAIGGHISQALALSESFSRLRDAAEAGRVLSGSLDLDETLAALARLSTAQLADVCEIELVGEEPRIYTSGRTCDPSLGPRIRELRAAYPRFRVGPGEAAGFPARSELIAPISEQRLQETALNPQHLALLRGLGFTSEIIVPLLARGRLLGAVSFGRVRANRPFTERDRLAAEDLASRAAIAIDNAALYKVAQSASRLKDEFLAMVSHELRTPLTSILGWARMLVAGLAPEKLENAYRVIERNANAQVQLIEDLLDTSRITSGQMRLDRQDIDLCDLIETAADSLRPALQLKNIALRLPPRGEACRVHADAARLQQVIWNLLSNALKFTPAGGHVEVALERRGEQVVLSVEDDGQGIAGDFLELVFEPFKQVEGGITRAQGGLGLGLAISRQLIELHGGTIRVSSAGEGCGSRFSVELPSLEAPSEISELEAPAAGAPLRASSELENVTILVVDDDADTRELLIEALHCCGAKVRGAASAAEAFELVARERPDILLSDIGMPSEDGYALMRRIRRLPLAQGGAIPAAAITAYTSAEDRSLALDAGFQLHLCKPIIPSALIEAAVSLSQMASTARSV
jgi:CheY-like chemotaxis protein/signal transduction histidine kinase